MSKFVVKGKISPEKLQSTLLAELAHFLNARLSEFPDFLRIAVIEGAIKIKLDVSVTASEKDIAGYNEIVVHGEQNAASAVLQFLSFCDDISVNKHPVSPDPASAVKTSHPCPKAVEESNDELLSRPISSLNLSIRGRKCMIRQGINTIGDLIKKTAGELLECKNFSETCLREVQEKLKDLGLKLKWD